ncbi:MAG: peptidoglycan synthetase [Bacteroidetes bacterium]|jgi:UDP-N-acetylmuramate: L-alanyl-gamma-D-glutamyl-meso-diaminopimelate ligase|nr:peptidoglycan synthetase [Bacteroidota bacterium]
MRVHFIAIGGAVMHNLALALHNEGHEVTGSDDEIFEPSKTRLKNKGLLPQAMGWFPERIDKSIDAVILGMHARNDNTELQKAREMELKIYSFPEYVFEQSKNKKRVVIAGSHGKTSITSMIMHVLKFQNSAFDYLVGSHVEGFETMVQLKNDSPVIIIEGDEYLTSALDHTPKFLWYKPHIAIISGIAWDHINVFPSFEEYKNQFARFIDSIQPGGKLFYFGGDNHVNSLLSGNQAFEAISYEQHPYKNMGEQSCLIHNNGETPIALFGKHNMENIRAAQLVCNELGVREDEFYQSISSFTGAGKRLEKILDKPGQKVYIDFAHAPSKLNATLQAVRDQFKEQRIIAIYELHTFSSLTPEYLRYYKNSLSAADEAFILYSRQTSEQKNLKPLTVNEIRNGFNHSNINIIDSAGSFAALLDRLKRQDAILLFMSSGNFFNVDVRGFFKDTV